jgi:histone H3/H4
LQPLKDLIGEGGAGRVSMTAVKALRDLLEGVGMKVARRAVDLAEHVGRETVKGEDISLAFDHWKRSLVHWKGS